MSIFIVGLEFKDEQQFSLVNFFSSLSIVLAFSTMGSSTGHAYIFTDNIFHTSWDTSLWGKVR